MFRIELRRNHLYHLIVALVLASMAVGCAQQAPAATPTAASAASKAAAPAPTAAPTQAAKGEILLGATAAATGPIQEATLPYLHAIDAYVKEANAKGGINGWKLNFLYMDDKLDAQTGLTNVRQLVEEKKINILIGNVGTPIVSALLPYVAEKGVPYLFPWAGLETVYNPLKKNVFTLNSDYVTQAKVFIPYFVDKVKPTKMAMIWADAEGLRQMAAHAKTDFPKRGVQIVADIPYQVGSVTEFSPIVQQLKNSGADALAVWTSASEAARIVQTMGRAGWKVPMVGHLALSDPALVKLGGADAEGLYAVTNQAIPSDKEITAEVSDLVKKYYPSDDIVSFHLYGVGVMRLVEKIIAGAANPQAYADIVKSAESLNKADVKIFPPVSFSPTSRLGLNSLAMTQVKNGTILRVSDWLPAQ